MRSLLIFVAFCVVCCCYGFEARGNSMARRNGYAFYFPHNVNANQPVKVCLAIDKHLLPAVVKTGFETLDCNGTTCQPHRVTADFSCWEITTPVKNNSRPSLSLAIKIETIDPNVKFEKNDFILYHNYPKNVLLETDRKTYKMGDTVKIRILAVDFDLKPLKDFKINVLQVKSPDPSSAIVKEWHNLSSSLGLVHLEFQLAPDTPEGNWNIVADNTHNGFVVEKYVLPRFQASLNGPERIYRGAASVIYTVCGKHSYGKNVKGVALLTAKNVFRWMYREPTTSSHVKNLTSGCAKFDIFRDLGLDKETIGSVALSASVTEDGTEQMESTKMNAYVHDEPYSQNLKYKAQHIKPKLPHTGEFILTDVQVPLSNSKVEICYKLSQTNAKDTCSNFTLGPDNRLQFVIPPIKDIPDDSRVEIQAKVIDHPLRYRPSSTLTIWHSKSRNGIKIMDSRQNPVDCESNLEYVVYYNSERFADDEEIYFKYIMTSRGDISNTGTVRDKPKKQPLNLDELQNVVGKESYDVAGNPVDKFTLKIKLDKNVYTDAKLIVYYDYDGEVISDTINVDVNKCGPNSVKAKWAEESLYPGEVGNLNIKADQGSLCSVSAVDKASTFLGSSSKINIENLLNGFPRHFHSSDFKCIKPPNNQSFSPFLRRAYYHGSSYSDLYDSYEAFKDSTIGVMSNLQFISKECKRWPYYHHWGFDYDSGIENRGLAIPLSGPTSGVMYAMPISGRFIPQRGDLAPAALPGPPGMPGSASLPDASVDDRGSAVRSFFPETWLWDLVTVEDGETNLERKLPDSITNWEGKVVCMSSDKGFGASDKIEIQGFKPFFVDILLPYSIKRNKEILHLPIPVFNYLNHSLPVRVTLEIGNGIVLVDGDDKHSFSMCLAAEDSYTHKYRIKATRLGSLNITVSGFVDPAYSEDCAPKSVIRRRDVVQKSLLVEPEGYPGSSVKSALLCANDSSGVDNIKWDINLPENVVPDTVDGKVMVNSDILGPMFQNLENILVVPVGCGEQTMATLTPNLYVLQYLQANNALTVAIKERIMKNLEIGYQRMLIYVHDDGSFSAFGKSDREGSMFLTAFVVRTFRQMQNHIFIDNTVIDRAVAWMKSHQLENGCFDPMSHVFHEMGLASSRNQTTALTSYVLISLLETNTNVDEDMLTKTKGCILSDSTIDKYTLAISSYALGLLNSNQKARKRLDKLMELSQSKQGRVWWKQSENSLLTSVETSSYVLISLLRQDPIANLGTAGSIVRWLQTQMNPRGAFYSTTDTVVGLDAISRYALMVNKKEPNVRISLTTKTNKKKIEITKRDRSRIDVLSLSGYPNEVKAKITGDGCVSVQAELNYYLDTVAALEDLKLDIDLKPVNQRFKCSFIELKPCVSYAGVGQINMAIVEVNMPSGYAPDQVSLLALKIENDSGVKKFEIIRNQVVFYLTQLRAHKVCLPFIIEENLLVENVANATVKFYDYYKPEVSISKSFKSEDCEVNINVPA